MSALSDPAVSEHPPRPAGLVWTKRAGAALFSAGLVGAVVFRDAFVRKSSPELLEGFLSALVVALGVVVIVVAERRLQDLSDAWREERRRERDPDAARRRVGTPRSVRNVPDAPRASRLLGGQSPLARALERVLIVYLVVGFPLCAALFGQLALFAYPGFALALLAAQDASDRGVSRGMRGPADPRRQREWRSLLASRRAWWAMSPPPVLRAMRTAFVLFAALGFWVCIARPALEDADPGARYRSTLAFAVGSLAGLALLAWAERSQRRRELRWVEERPEGRGGA